MLLSKVAQDWMEVKRDLMSVDKTEQTVRIVENYKVFDFILLQEATAALAPALNAAMPSHTLIVPPGARGQDSLILAKKDAMSTELTDETARFVEAAKESAPELAIEPGYACVVSMRVRGENVVIGSYHSDSDGKMTVPFVNAFTKYTDQKLVKGLLGIDGNMASDPDKGKLYSHDFREAIARHGWHSCLPDDVWTTFKARTFVQPQFQKAVLSKNLSTEADMGPKDHILAAKDAYFARAARDTSGQQEFLDRPLPTKTFPSDHAIVAAHVLL